jgi:hypothetical protein
MDVRLFTNIHFTGVHLMSVYFMDVYMFNLGFGKRSLPIPHRRLRVCG